MTLNELANKYGTDKGDAHFEKHNYAEIYDELMGGSRELPINFVEIGINDPRFPGASVHMWRSYFKNGTYRGLDINLDKTLLTKTSVLDKVYLYNVDQTKLSQLVDFAESIPPIDFVVDDGIHTYEAQTTSFYALYTYLKPGGMYFIEDCHAKDCRLTVNMFYALKERSMLVEDESKFNLSQSTISFYNNDKLIVIHKHATS
jgi:demethylmacrocin O-methyltransferase